MPTPNSEYWAERFKLMENALQNKSLDYADNLEQQFKSAVKDIDIQIRAWYQRLAVNNKVSYAAAQKLLSKNELKEFKWTVWQYIEKAKDNAVSGEWEKQLENASARVHISRLEALKIQLQQRAEELANVRISTTKEAAETAYINSYYHTAFEVQKGLGVGWTMQALNERELQKVLSRPWTADNRTFTARCWTDKNKLVQIVNQELTRMIATGAPPDKAIETIANQLNVSGRNAARVVMTESAYFASAAQRDCFNDLDVEQFQVVGALSKSTCEYCGSLDGKVFPMSEFRAGETAPPFHPWCRCCTAPYFADMEGLGERYARDVVSGKRYKVPGNTTYEQWKSQQDAAYGEGTVDKARKMWYNKKADRAQYEKYVQRLGKNAPRTFEDFQKIKYSDDWSAFKAYSKSIKNGDLTALADFDLYKAVSAKIDKKLIGVTTSNGIIITGKSNHFIDRVIGSVEQRRSGVSADDILYAIKNPIRVGKIREEKDGRSQKFYGKKVIVSVNPDTGVLIQTNPFTKN